MSNKFQRNNDIISVIIPHPYLLSRGEWLAFGISKILHSTVLVTKPLSIKPLIAFPLYNILTLIKFLLKKQRYSVVIVFSCFLFPMVYFLKKVNLINLLVYDDADYLPSFTNNIISKKLVSILENFAISKANVVISASQILANLRRRVNPNVCIVENGFSWRLCRCIDFINTAPLSNRNFIYIGNIDFDYVHLDTIVRAFVKSEVLKESKLYIAGKGKDLSKLQSLIAGVTNVVLVSFTNVADQVSVLKEGIFGLAPYRLKGSALFGVPLKIKEYMASGHCIIVSEIKPIIYFIKKFGGCHYIINDPSNEEQVRKILEEAFVSYAENISSIINRISLSAKIICHQYTWDKVIIKYIKCIKNIIMKF